MLETNHTYDYDVVVIGAGPGGTEAARELGRHGKKVAIIESNAVGGTCLNRGCIPAKTMLYMAEMYRLTNKMADYGIIIEPGAIKVDYPGMLKRRDDIMDRLRKGLTFQIKKDNVELIAGFATVTDPHTIKVNDQNLTAASIILATGGTARRFPGFVEEDKRFLVSDNIFELDHLPKSIAIVGAGPVGTEFASYYRAFGVEVHLFEMGETFFPYFDHKLGQALIKEFERDGINVHTSTTIDNIDTSQQNLKITLNNQKAIETEYILSAIGVQVNNEYLTALNLETEQSGRIKVNNKLQTSYEHIYALGDLIGKSGSAYGAEREGKYIAYEMLGLDTNLTPVDYINFPDVVFTHPEVGTCGYSEQELQKQGIKYTTRHVQYMVNAKANVKSERYGYIWMYVEETTEKILGVHIVGAEATELIHQIPVVLVNKLTVTEYLKTVWGHPVMAELIKDVVLLG